MICLINHEGVEVFGRCRLGRSSALPETSVPLSGDPVPGLHRGARTEPQEDALLRGRLPSDVRPTRYDLALEVLPDQERFHGMVDISLVLQRARAELHLHGQNLNVTDLRVRDAMGTQVGATWESSDGHGASLIRLEHPLEAGPARIYGKVIKIN